jgi:hypothetical protein
MSSSAVLKAGAIGAAAGLAFAIVGRISFVACIVGPLGWIIAVGTGVLYVYFAARDGEPVGLAEGALGGGIAGAVSGGAQALLTGALTLAFGAVQAASDILGGEIGSAAIRAGGTAVGLILAVLLGTIVAGALGAVGGAVFALLRGTTP